VALESGLILEALNDQHRLNGLTSEPSFLRHLRLERRRSERSRQPFALMLIEPRRRDPENARSGLLERTASVIVSAIRETDVAGWYKSRCLGVIFAEVGPRDKGAVIAALRARTITALRSTLRPDEIEQLALSFYWFPDEWREAGPGSPTAVPLYSDVVQPEKNKRLPLAMKRAIDIIGSASILIVLSPVLLAIAVAIKRSSPGGVIFRQERVGQHGVRFTLFKFRSMYADSDATPHKEFIKRYIAGGSNAHADVAPNGAVFKLTKDSRVTPIGRFLRKTSLDEFPQLFNVLRGEMSLVGPRPPIPYELEGYAAWHRRRLLEAKPGVTGLWQVTGRSSLKFDDMVRLDLRYARGWSLWLDLKILLRTARVVLSGAGAY
jgi:lipopolysaccharide/colanic/teichoic acid biosynthesis glycosyltransferase